MERLAGMDASFFYIETPTQHMHVMALVILDPMTMPGGYSFSRLRGMFERRLSRLPRFRQRVRMVPLGLDHPVWEDDPDFDLDSHLHHVALPLPGTQRELARLVADVASRPLDRTVPLWEAWVIEGLERGRVALFTKVHHAAMDGVSGAAVLAYLLDGRPDMPEPEVEPWTPIPPAWEVALLARGLWSSTNRLRLSHLPTFVGEIGRSVVDTLRAAAANVEDLAPALPFETPILPFNRAISPRRAVAFARTRLDDLKLIRSVFGVTVNDVVLAACTLSLRRYLQRQHELPAVPLVAAVPVAVRSETDRDKIDNRVSTLFVRLPVHLDHPIAQLEAVAADTARAKALHRAVGGTMLRDLVQFAPAPIFSGMMQLYSRLRLADRHRPPVNLIISNVPGPQVPLYAAGAQVESIFPMGPIIDGAGLNLTVLSNTGRVDFGAIGCRETVPELDTIAEGFAEAIDELVTLGTGHTRSAVVDRHG
jgi:diacylglycerol O-acyltransferase / wax synthase